MIKKIFAVTISILAFTFVSYAIGASKNDKQNDSDALTIIGFSQIGAESYWRLAHTQSMKKTFSGNDGYKLIIKDAQQRQSRQIAAIRDFIAKKVDFIVLAPVTEAGWDNVLKEAKNAGIPFIIVDQMIKTASNELFTCWVGSDFRKEGDLAVSWMEKTFGRDKELIIAHLQGNLGSSAQIGRTEPLKAAERRNHAWKVIARESGYFTTVKGKEAMERFLKLHPRIDVLYCENDNMAFGAIEAMEALGRTYGVKGATKIISFDATHAGLTATLEGKINYNVECNPLHGPRVKEIVRQLKKGKHPEKFSHMEEAAFDAATITRADIDKREY